MKISKSLPLFALSLALGASLATAAQKKNDPARLRLEDERNFVQIYGRGSFVGTDKGHFLQVTLRRNKPADTKVAGEWLTVLTECRQTEKGQQCNDACPGYEWFQQAAVDIAQQRAGNRSNLHGTVTGVGLVATTALLVNPTTAAAGTAGLCLMGMAPSAFTIFEAKNTQAARVCVNAFDYKGKTNGQVIEANAATVDDIRDSMCKDLDAGAKQVLAQQEHGETPKAAKAHK